MHVFGFILFGPMKQKSFNLGIIKLFLKKINCFFDKNFEAKPTLIGIILGWATLQLKD